MRCLCFVLLLALTVHAEDAEELTALLLSPHEAYRKRGRALIDRAPERAAALDLIARWAHRPAAFADHVTQRLTTATGAEKARLQRLARILEDPKAPAIGIDVYLVSLPHVDAARIVGNPALTRVSNDPAHWGAWWKAIRQSGGDLVDWRSVAAIAGRTSWINTTKELAYIQDFDVEIANGMAIADPVIDVVQLPRKLSLRPVLSRDRRFVTIQLDVEFHSLERPVEVAVKKLPVGTAKIQKPKVVEQAARQTVTLPLGGHAAWTLQRGKERTIVAILHAVRGAPTAMEPPKIKPR